MDPRISNTFIRVSQSLGTLSTIFNVLIDPRGRIPDVGLVALTGAFDDLLDKEDPAVQVALRYRRSLREISKALAPVLFNDK